MKHDFARRLGVLALGTTLAVGTYIPAAEAVAAPSAASAADWIAGDLSAGNVYTNPYSTPPPTDAGLTIDAGFAAVAAGNSTLVARIQQGLAANVSPLSAPDASPSATAKALAFATRSGADPTNFGGLNLVGLMESRVDGAGRLNGSGSFGIFGQALAAQGLSAAGSSKGAAAVAYLQGLQCTSGAFGSDLPAAGAAPACTADPSDTSADNTASAAIALTSLAPTASTNATIDKAAAFLVSVGQNGGYTDGFNSAPNSNSTGLAAALLGAACRVAAADSAADVVRSLQVPTGALGPLAGESGAVAFTQADLETARANGIDDPFVRDTFRRSTTQATTGLIWDTSAPASVSVTGPTARVAKSSSQTITVNGAARGETVCLTTPAGVQRLVGTGAPLAVQVTAPANGAANFSATTGPGAATYALRTGDPKAQLLTKRVAIGGKVKVQIAALQPGTKVVTKIRGTKVDRTRAKANGVATVKFRLAGKAAKAAKVFTIGKGQVRKVALKIKPAGTPAVKTTLRISKR